MDPLGTTLGIGIAIGLAVASGYFIRQQRQTMARLLAIDAKITLEQRRFLVTQCRRRFFGAVLLMVLACMLFGSVFLDYDPLRMSPENVPQVDDEAAKQSVRFLSLYLATMLLTLMAIFTLAALDFWAVARYGVRQQKQLALEHQELLAAELAAHKQRQSS